MEQEDLQHIQDLQSELDQRRRQEGNVGAASIFATNNNENLIRWQLDLKEDLERIDHLLRGHILKFDKEGNLTYEEPDNLDLKPFNEYGVQLIMNVISFYLNRNTILSNYDEVTINWKVYDFGIELTDLIYNKYEEMGMDTADKQKLFPMMVREIVDTVHSSYLRALKGGERDSLRTARTVSQNEPMGTGMGMLPMQNQKKFSLFSPSSWFGKK